MSNYAEIIVLTEGKTEQRFIKRTLAPYMGERRVFLTPARLRKPGGGGGDVRYVRAKNDIERYLKKRQDTWITLLIDYYGIGRDWPGIDAVRPGASPIEIAQVICTATQSAIDKDLPNYRSGRFVPHIAIYEFEALLFSDPKKLANGIEVDQSHIDSIIEECGEPEAIDNSQSTAPSKRIENLCSRFRKTSTGISIADEIGVDRMRSKCPVFNDWLKRLEALAEAD